MGLLGDHGHRRARCIHRHPSCLPNSAWNGWRRPDRFFGKRNPDELPGYIAGADLLMFPYVQDTEAPFRGLSLKFFEYLISGKPVITTPYTEFDPQTKELLFVAPDTDAWVGVLTACENKTDPQKGKRRIALAHENTYEMRLQRQRDLLARLETYRKSR